jgi:hypothetical protein
LALNPLGTAKLLGEGFATAEFFQFSFPGHALFSGYGDNDWSRV